MEDKEMDTEKEERSKLAKKIQKKILLPSFISMGFGITIILILVIFYSEEFRGGNFTGLYWLTFFIAGALIMVPVIIACSFVIYYQLKLIIAPLYRELFKQYKKK